MRRPHRLDVGLMKGTRQLTSAAICAAVLTLAASEARSDSASSIYEEQNKLFRAARHVTTLGPSLFGDKVNVRTGALEFVQTDVSLPGNSALPVAVGRRLVAGQEAVNGLFGSWDLEIPHLHGIFANVKGWAASNGPSTRCSIYRAAPGVSESGAGWSPEEYWHGNFLYVPGHGDQEMLGRMPANTLALADNPAAYPIVTRQQWQIGCLPAMAPGNGSAGEAFVAVSPDGTTYRFDWMVSRPLDPLTKGSAVPVNASAPSEETSQTSGTKLRAETSNLMLGGDGFSLARSEYWILPTLVTDRFGNTVTYTYDTTNKWQLKSIVGTDAAGSARTITFTYLAAGVVPKVRTVSDGSRTWTYNYASTVNGIGALQSVTLPDNSQWQVGGIEPLLSGVMYLGSGSCEVPGVANSYEMIGSMTHPSGARGEFVLKATRHGRVGVENSCNYDLNAAIYSAEYPRVFDTNSLIKKTISGPGLNSLTWETTYAEAKPSWAPWDGQNGTTNVDVTGPDGNVTRYTYGTVYRQTEGQLQMTEQLDANGNVMRRTGLRYKEVVPPFGYTLMRRGDSDIAAKVLEVDQRLITQQGSLFTWEAELFNVYAQPTRTRRYSGSDSGRTELTVFKNDSAKWILGRLESVSEGGKVSVLNKYDAASNLESITRFGQKERSMTYNADGTLATQADNLGRTTTYTNYKRGTPQNVTFADSTVASAVVNNIGGIDSYTDASSPTATTNFSYDAMGRFKSIAYPGGDPVNWNTTEIRFEQIATPEFGLEPGHWRQKIWTGYGYEISYMDALWRPVYSERYDEQDAASTRRTTRRQYDADGRITFESYPARDEGGAMQGVRNEYDALGRLSARHADSELGVLTTTNWYNPSVFQTVHTNARGFQTTYAYQTFDQPSEDAIATIVAPEGVRVDIARDAYGKPKSITRGGGGKSLVRRYVYDANERLCKTVEPETKATVQAYDGAGNLDWRATGLDLMTDECDNGTGLVADARKTVFKYDTRNRLWKTTYGDASPMIERTYTPDGLPATVTSNGAAWKYDYNKRRLMTGETLAYGGKTYVINRQYDANGSLSQLDYPLGALSVGYNPNALGEARKVGGYATGIQYKPNGAVSSFTYGNGIVRTFKQNIRGLPERSTDAGVLDEQYSYDENGNTMKIEDLTLGPATRTMEVYDGLDRLKGVQAPMLWGTATYAYDALDNLVSSAISGGANARTLTHTINPATNRLDSISGSTTPFNFAYGYDAQGNITSRGTQTYTFDQANRMKAASARATYAYDGLGRRVSSIGTDGVNTIQIYTQDGKLIYSGPPGSTGTKYVYLNNHVIAEVK